MTPVYDLMKKIICHPKLLNRKFGDAWDISMTISKEILYERWLIILSARHIKRL